MLSELYTQIFKAALEFVREEGTEMVHIDLTAAQNHLHIMNGFLQLFEAPSQQKRDGIQVRELAIGIQVSRSCDFKPQTDAEIAPFS